MKFEKMLLIKNLELKWRTLLITFSIILFFSFYLDKIVPGAKKIVLFHIPIYLPILIVVSYGIAVMLQKETLKIFNINDEDWSDEEDSKERWTIFYRYLGIVALYYVTQLGICVVFIPEFIEYKFLNTHFYFTFFLFNCYWICRVYSKTIFRNNDSLSTELQ